MHKTTAPELQVHQHTTGRYRFVAGQPKPCKNCEVEFMPVARTRETREKYATGLFCSELCEGKYIKRKVAEMGMPRPVKKEMVRVNVDKRWKLIEEKEKKRA